MISILEEYLMCLRWIDMSDNERIRLLEETILLLVKSVDIHYIQFHNKGLSENEQDILMKNIATFSIDSKRVIDEVD